MCDDHSHQREDTPDPLTEFLAQLLTDFPDVLSTPVTTTPSPLPTTSASAAAAYHAPNPHLTCQWVSPHGPPLICGVYLPQDPKHACDHFRYAHDVRGNEKVHVPCHWRDCNTPQMLRGSLIRHVLTVHLRLLRWRCEVCGRMFSRRGTGHPCTEGG